MTVNFQTLSLAEILSQYDTKIPNKIVGDGNFDKAEFFKLIKESYPEFSDEIVQSMWDSLNKNGVIEINDANLATIKAYAAKIAALLQSPRDQTVSDFFKACAVALGLKESALNLLMLGLDGKDLASTLKTTNAMQTMSSIITQILKMNNMFAEKLDSAASPR